MSAPAHGSESMLGLAVRSVLAAIWFAAMFFVGIPALVWWLSGAPTPGALGARGLLGASMILAAHVLLVREIVTFVVRGRGTHAPFEPPTTLVDSGLYARVRNPMYLLYLLVIVGEALVLGSWALLAYSVVFFGLAHLYVARVEEPGLRARFGEDYARYADRVPRWVPSLR